MIGNDWKKVYKKNEVRKKKEKQKTVEIKTARNSTKYECLKIDCWD